MIDRRAEDRWIGAPVRKASLAMSGVVIASLMIHTGVLFLAATFGERPPPAPPNETVVELVQEPAPAPKPPETAKDPPKGQATDDLAKGPSTSGAATTKAAETPKAEIKPDPPQPEPPQPEQAKADEPKPEPRSAPQAKMTAPKPVEAKPLDPKPVEPEPPKAAESQAADQAKDGQIAEKEAALQSLRQELDSLKAEQDALKAEAIAEMQTVDKATDAMGAKGFGRMPPSFGAMQLPQLSEIEGEAAGYEQIVFSQLARTKGVRQHMGLVGTAEIVFTIDASGKLVTVKIAHPSGIAQLDDEAMQIVTASAPFPKPPPGATRTIAANFNFVPQPAP